MYYKVTPTHLKFSFWVEWYEGKLDKTTPTRRNECHVISSSDNNVNNMAATGKDTTGIQRIPDDFSLKYFVHKWGIPYKYQ